MAISLAAVARYRSAVLAATVLALTACGGGGGSGSTQPANLSVSGVVIDGAIQGATVCVDLNKNGTCDAGEPMSSATDAQGNYTITGLTSDQANSFPLVAMVPVGAVDAVSGAVTKAYTLSAPQGKGAVISPITTMVLTGMAQQGMTQQAAEAAVAAQFHVSATNLYNNYTLSSSGDNPALAVIAPVVVTGLQTGTPLRVSTSETSAAGYYVRVLNFTDPSNYYLRYYYSTNVPDSSGNYAYYDERTWVFYGSQMPAANVYDTTLYASAQGWSPFTGATVSTHTGGSPDVSNQGGYLYVSNRSGTDVSGMAIADVVKLAQDLSVNTSSTLRGVDPTKLSGTMPNGAKVMKIYSVNTVTPVAYRNGLVYTSVGAVVPALTGVSAAYPVPTAPMPANTLSMGFLHGYAYAGCTQMVCTQEALRVAFGANNATTYYLCDVNYGTYPVQLSNCVVAGTGSYALGKAADGVTPIMTFAGLPAATNVQTYTRVFVERSGSVYYGFQDKPTTTTTTRLNEVAFEALAKALGITPPAINSTVSPYAGTWSATYTGSDSGKCASVAIDANGNLSAYCTSSISGRLFAVMGTVSGTGAANFGTSSSTTTGATSFGGTFTATSASGTWALPGTTSQGTWTAQKLY